MPESIRIVVEEQSQTAEARRAAQELAHRLGFDETRCGQISIVVTEACTNLLKHAGGGEILLTSTSDGNPGILPDIEMLALDRGPGMRLDQCMIDGFSTGSSYGQGLGAIVRLSSASDFYSDVKRGTALLARWSRTSPEGSDLRLGAVNVPKPGQEVCGDSWGAEQNGPHCVIMVADGLGHGSEAQAASLEAVRILHSHADLPPGALIQRAHQALRSSRGAAVAVARIDRDRGTLVFAGAGNISAQIYAGASARQHLVSVNGTAGHQVQRLREFSYPWPGDGMLVLHSDGLSTNTSLETYPGLALRDPSLIAGILYRDFTRRNDDATVVVAKAA